MPTIRMFPLRPKANADEGIRACARIAGTKEADGTTWQQCAYEGEWHGHGAGGFELNAEIFEQTVVNFARREDDVPVMHGHPGLGDPEAAYRGAAGWIKELKVGEDDKGRVALFARVEWTPRTLQKLADDEYRYCSVVITFDSVDETSGESIGAELLELGIVPAAFLDGMPRLAASRAGRANPRALAQKATPQMDLNEIIKRAQKELPEGYSAEDLQEYIRLASAMAALLSGESAESEAPAEEPAEEVAASAEAPAETVELEDGMPEPAESQDSNEEARGMFADWGESFAAELGVDFPALISVMQENADAIAAIASGAPAEGTPADEADMAAMSKTHGAAIAELSRVQKAQVELQKKLAEKDHALELREFEVTLSRHVLDNDITDDAMNRLVAMSQDTKNYEHLALKFARNALSEALGKDGKVVPGKPLYNESKPKDAPHELSGMTREEAIAKAEEALRANAAKDGVLLRKKELRAQSYELAKSTHPEAFGIKTNA